MISSTQLSAIVQAAKALGERQVTTQLPDGTIIEVHLTPEGEAPAEPTQPNCHPIALLMQRLKNQTIQLN